MKIIHLSEYNSSLGTLIDVRNAYEYKIKHDERSINIPSDKLILNHKIYLNKNNKYYIMCDKGYLSKKVIRSLEYFGYDLTQVIK